MGKKRRGSVKELRRFYEEAVSLCVDGEVPSEILQERFGLSPYGASCILFMLRKQAFHPELAKIYVQDEMPSLEGVTESTYRGIRFLDDMPPYYKGRVYDTTCISENDQEVYVKMGIAERASMEDQRQEMVFIYSSICEILNQHDADMLEAISHRDEEFIRNFFAGSSKAKVLKHMRREKLKSAQHIKTVLEILGYND